MLDTVTIATCRIITILLDTVTIATCRTIPIFLTATDGLDLETVQLLYEKQKSGPLIVRNSPPVAGNILWARQLMRRIELPMQRFQEHASLMSTKVTYVTYVTYVT